MALHMTRKFRKTRHYQVDMGLLVSMLHLEVELCLELGNTSPCPVHPSCELGSINHTFSKAVDEALYPSPQLLALRFERLDILRGCIALASAIPLYEAWGIFHNLTYEAGARN
jgi:hypothetical protein